MNRLPKYVIVSDDDLAGDYILKTDRPMVVGKVYKIETTDREALVRQAQRMRDGSTPMAKVAGFTVFLTRWTVVGGDRADYDETVRTLQEMADYYLRAKILKKRWPFRKYDEAGDGYYQRKIAEGRERKERE